MKELLKAYSIRAHETSRACDNYTCAAGFKMGYGNAEMHLRNNERDMYMQVMRFPEKIALIPVVVFTIGVTYRLVVSVAAAALMRFGTYMHKATKPASKE